MANKGNKASKPQAVKCTVCGKPLTGVGINTASGVCGKLCASRLQAGYNAQKLAVLKQANSVSVPPANFIKVAQLHLICKANFIPVSRMVRCMGGDTAMGAPAHPICKPVYCNGARYVNNWLATKAGLQAMLTGNFSGAPQAASKQAASNAIAQASKPQASGNNNNSGNGNNTAK